MVARPSILLLRTSVRTLFEITGILCLRRLRRSIDIHFKNAKQHHFSSWRRFSLTSQRFAPLKSKKRESYFRNSRFCTEWLPRLGLPSASLQGRLRTSSSARNFVSPSSRLFKPAEREILKQKAATIYSKRPLF
jgi:hypothetical protein